MSPRDELGPELARRIERGDTQAKDTMILSNLRLVVAIAASALG